MKNAVKILSSLFLASALSVVAGESRTENTILKAATGKWQRVIVRMGSEIVNDDTSPNGLSETYYAVELDDYTRDRDGQGVFRESVTRLLNCDGKDVKETKTAEGVEFELRFNQGQGEGKSVVRITATKKTDGDDVYYSVKFSGDGIIFDAFQSRFTEAVDGAEWVESIDAIRWEYFEPGSA